MKKQNLALAVSAALVLSACGGSSDKDNTPQNVAPSDITLSAMKVDENMAGATIGTLSATDADSGDTHTYSVEGDMFKVDGNTLKLADNKIANYEMAKELKAKVTAKDKAGATLTKELTISVSDLPDYDFMSKFKEGESSVSYTGQTARHALIAELTNYIGDQLQKDIDDETLKTRDDVLNALNRYFRTSTEQYDNFALKAFDGAKQGFLADISSSHKSLEGKIAGRDPSKQHKNWLQEGENSGQFAGWNAKGSTTPEKLVDIFFGQLADNAEIEIGGTERTFNGKTIPVYLNTDGTDLKQLIQKFLLMAITYSQGTDDYLDEGLGNDNTAGDSDGAKPYSSLEHQFDEGFGYFGAARDYLAYTDDEIAKKGGRDNWQGKHDTNGDGKIDLTSEINFGQSVNAAKRDRGTKDNAKPTDFTKTTMEAFIAGRKIINDAAGNALTDAQMTELKAQRDIAVDGWEKAIAATVIHYINDTRADLEKLKTNAEDYSYSDLAKHWSEMKGFGLGLQFNPHSDITDAQFEQIHTLMGTKPVMVEADDIETYRDNLLQARDIIAEALKLNSENVEKW
ncbi:DUF4856 domain-containing protein [Parashewanella curva]|uniref:DUF4856 domain-containing protein n=1 Tax=Parashewanella curva TaxID=2338552 RepID=A0A3L8PXX6_9GAMM|nr:DUF4856 domain-containing protein [Parashewanella curva]RLV60307.1 DUF4856 domain-containing protein [Parashewanella curva]